MTARQLRCTDCDQVRDESEFTLLMRGLRLGTCRACMRARACPSCGHDHRGERCGIGCDCTRAY